MRTEPHRLECYGKGGTELVPVGAKPPWDCPTCGRRVLFIPACDNCGDVIEMGRRKDEACPCCGWFDGGNKPPMPRKTFMSHLLGTTRRLSGR